MKKRFISFAKVLTTILLVLPLLLMTEFSHATEYDDCGFGNVLDYDDEYNEVCVDSVWVYGASNDGFSKSIYVYREAENVDYESDIKVTHTIGIECTKKLLKVYVWDDPLDMYPDTKLNGYGSVLVKFDNGKISPYTFVHLDDYSGFSLTKAKTFTTALLKSKEKFAFKVGVSGGYMVANFAKSDIQKYVAKFKAAGCALS